MTVFDISEIGRWFDLDDGGRVQIQSMTAEKHKEIRRATVKKKTDFKKVEGTPARFDYEVTDDEKADEMFWDHTIVAWENFKDGKGNDIPCTRENKLLLIRKSPKFARIVVDALKILSDAEAEDAKTLEKN